MSNRIRLNSVFSKGFTKWRGVIISLILILLLVTVPRSLGLLQPLEWMAFDFYFQRPLEAIFPIFHFNREARDDRIAIVAITESDYRRLRPYYPMKDIVLAELLEKIQAQQPRVIGLDLYRDRPVDPEFQQGYEKLTQIFRQTENLIGIEKVIANRETGEEAILAPPALLEAGRSAANDIVIDPDGFLRRALLVAYPETGEGVLSFSLVVASLYLQQEGINIVNREDRLLELGKTVFPPFEASDGSYVGTDAGGYQMLINWRIPANNWQKISLFDVLDGKIDSQSLHDKIVLIGAIAPSLNDIFDVPSNRELFKSPLPLYGVEVQANIISQIISAVKDERPLIQVFPDWLEFVWTMAWTGIALGLIWNLGRRHNQLLFNWSEFPFYSKSLQIIIFLWLLLFSFTYLAFIRAAWWLPVVTPSVGILTALFLMTRAVYVDKIRQINANLETQVKSRTAELNSQTQQLEKTLNLLQEREEQLVAQYKLVSLGTLVEGICHELNNSLNVIDNYATVLEDEGLELKATHSLLKQEEQQQIEVFNQTYNSDSDDLKLEINNQRESQSKLAEARQDFDTLIDNILELYIPTIKKHVGLMSSIFKNMRFHGFGSSRRKVASELELADFNQVVAEGIKIVTKALEKSSNSCPVEIQANLDEEIGQFYLDVTDITQVIINLVKNAIDAVNNQEAQTISSDYQPEVIVSTQERGDFVEIRVADNGEGIARENFEKIFEQFFTTKERSGTGLGLSITYDIVVKKNRGTITFESQVNQGTEFLVSWRKTI